MRTENFQMFKLDLEKTKEPEIKLPASIGSWRKQRSSRKNVYFCFIDYVKAFDCMYHNELWKILKHMGVPDHLSPEKPICRSRSNSLNWTGNSRLVKNWERRTSRLYIVPPLI